jgi:hypothetical protein
MVPNCVNGNRRGANRQRHDACDSFTKNLWTATSDEVADMSVVALSDDQVGCCSADGTARVACSTFFLRLIVAHVAEFLRPCDQAPLPRGSLVAADEGIAKLINLSGSQFGSLWRALCGSGRCRLFGCEGFLHEAADGVGTGRRLGLRSPMIDLIDQLGRQANAHERVTARRWPTSFFRFYRY